MLKSNGTRQMRLIPLLLVAMMLIVARSQAQTSPKEDPTAFSFVVCADPHASENRAGELTAAEKFHQFLQQVKSLKRQPDFILIAGDLHVKAFQEILANEKPTIPIHVTPGNHESMHDRQRLDKMFPDDFKGKDFYSFRHKGCLFVAMCDAGINGDHVGHFDSEAIRGQDQCEWLKSQLASKAGPTFVFAHIPPHPQGKVPGKMFLSTNDQKYLRELAAEYKPVAMFFGHLHYRMEFKIAESLVFVAPSLNWTFSNKPRGFFETTVSKNNIEVKFIPIEQKK